MMIVPRNLSASGHSPAGALWVAPAGRTPVELVEVKPGRMKPLSRCSKRERARAAGIELRKAALIAKWLELVPLLGEAWTPYTPIVQLIAEAKAAGVEPQTNLPLEMWEQDVEALEAALTLKQATDEVN